MFIPKTNIENKCIKRSTGNESEAKKALEWSNMALKLWSKMALKTIDHRANLNWETEWNLLRVNEVANQVKLNLRQIRVHSKREKQQNKIM